MNDLKCGFVLIPDYRTVQEAIKLSRAVQDNKLMLGENSATPHLTVLQTTFKAGFDYKAALKDLRTYRGFNFEPRSSMGAVTLHTNILLKSFIYWEVKNAEWLNSFNRDLIHAYEHEIVKPADAGSHDFKSSAIEESYRRTGYEYNLEAYEPHLTLAVTDNDVILPKAPKTADFIRFRELAFVENGEFGEIKRILASESLPISWE